MIQYHLYILLKNNLQLLVNRYKAKIFSNKNNYKTRENIQYSTRLIIRY